MSAAWFQAEIFTVQGYIITVDNSGRDHENPAGSTGQDCGTCMNAGVDDDGKN